MDQARKANLHFEYKYSIKIIKKDETFAEELNLRDTHDNRLINLTNFKDSKSEIYFKFI